MAKQVRSARDRALVVAVLGLLLSAQGATLAGSRPLALDLVGKLNNDGTAVAGPEGYGNFDRPYDPEGAGGAYPAEFLPRDSLRIPGAPDASFVFPLAREGVVNNFTCEGQRFRLPPGRAVAAYLLGAGGKSGEKVIAKFYYEGGRQVEQLSFSDWLASAPEAGDTEALRLPYHYRVERSGPHRQSKSCALWLRKYNLNPKLKLRSLSFTYNQHVHIFAITLLCTDWTAEHSEYAERTAKSYQLLSGSVKSTYQRFVASVDGLRAQLAGLPAEVREKLSRQAQWVRTEVELAASRLPEDRLQLTARETEELEAAIRGAASDVRALLKLKNPFATRRGIVLNSYHSELDDTLQPYWLYVPKTYTGRQPFPLVVSLHGHGWYRPFQGYPREVEKERYKDQAIVLSPHGRGSIDYMLASEDDVIRCIEETGKDYNIDSDRVYLTGRSMGGTGTWNIGLKFPDVFAGLAPIAGNADSKAWERLWGWPKPDDSTIGKVKAVVSYAIDPVSHAENLANLPVFCLHGSDDPVVPTDHSRSMAQRVRGLKRDYPFIYREPKGAGHGAFTQQLIDEQRKWLLGQRRVAVPKRVCLRTMKLRHGQACWLKLEALAAPLQYANVVAEAEESGAVRITATGAMALTLDVPRSPAREAKTLSVKVNGASAYEGPAPADGRLTLVQSPEGVWRPGLPSPGLRKMANLEGPIEDAFLSPFVLAYGTSSDSLFDNRVAEAEARRLAGDWERMYGKPCRVKRDTEVTDEDIQRLNLVLYGGPRCNAVTARMAEGLPIRIEAGRVTLGDRTFSGDDVGVKFCFPNPLNPTRYAVVFAGTTWRGLYQIVNRFGNWFHWGPFDNRNWFDYGVFDDRTSSPETFLCFGFFDTNWQIDPRFQWAGYEKERQASQPRRLPSFASVAELPASSRGAGASTRTRLYLSDLLPAGIDQHKGVVSSDRSFQGRSLCVGTKPYEKGLGLRAPSCVELDIGGKFERFRAEVGVDLEGGTKLNRVRKDNEWIQFEVQGDDRCLYRSNWLQGDSPPCSIDVAVSGVKKLGLQVNGSSARWHLGSAAWGRARVTGKGW